MRAKGWTIVREFVDTGSARDNKRQQFQALMLSTGKGGAYRYYTCANRRLKGREACKNHLLIVGVQVPEPFWDIPLDKLNALGNAIRAPAVPV